MADLTVGSVLGGYRIDGIIGQGGMGVVYKATQLGLDRTVAVKVIAPGLANHPGFRDRFGREARLAASIDHNNVVPVYEAGEEDGLLYLAMRFVDGKDLSRVISESGRLDAPRAAAIIRQVASALNAAHKRGLVHRDVKPGNILIVGGPGEEHAYLTDFGLTKKISADQGLTKTGEWVGTIDYAAPEQIDGRPIDARTDVYALGCVLYHALTGIVPFDRDSDVAKMYAHLHDAPSRVGEKVPGTSPELDAVVLRAMAKDPEQRFPSTGDLGKAAVAAATGQPLVTPEASVAVGAAAPGPAEPTRVSDEATPTPETVITPAPTEATPPPAEPTTPAAAPPPAEPTTPAAVPPRPAEPTTPAAAPPQPEPAAAPPPQPTGPTAPQPAVAPTAQQPAAVTPPPYQPVQQPAPSSGGGGGRRGLWIGLVLLLVLVAAGVGAAAGGVFSSDDDPGGGTTTVSDTTPTATATDAGEPTATPTAKETRTASPTAVEKPPPPGVCGNRFISSSQRAELSGAMGTNDAAVQGTVFYGVCGGDTWAIARFPDGRSGAFIRRDGEWVRFGSINQGICQIPDELLADWKMAC